MAKFIRSKALYLLLLPIPAMAANVISDGYRDFDTPVNYEYTQVALGGGQFELDDADESARVMASNVTTQMLLNRNWLVGLNYKTRFTHFDDDSRNRDDFVAGIIGYRYGLFHKTDLLAQGRVGYSWLNVKDGDDKTTDSDSNFVSAANIGVYHGFSDALEARVIAEYMDSEISYERSFEVAADYYFNAHFAFGLYGKYIDTDDGNYELFGIATKFRF